MFRINRYTREAIAFFIEVFSLPFLLFCALFARCYPKKIDIGIGPDPLINNIYHKQALLKKGYSVETFVDNVFYITQEFDVRADLLIKGPFIRKYYLFFRTIFFYKAIYIYFNGGALRNTFFQWRFEPFLYKIAKVKVVVTAYGGDVQDLSLCSNLLYKHFLAVDYPHHKYRRERISKNIDLWTQGSSHVIAGCDWVDYLYHWDTLAIAHFCIDTEKFNKMSQNKRSDPTKPLRIIHAPNHKGIKGTQHLINIVEQLQKEGEDVELVLFERVDREVLLSAMKDADIVADQFIIGWYAMFAIEAMAMGKPVMCYLREDFTHLYEASGLLSANEMPIINCNLWNLKEKIKYFIHHREELESIGLKSSQYINNHHSLDFIGTMFHRVNKTIGLAPSLSQAS